MQLPPDQVERFYAVWKPLLLFVNRRLRLVPGMLPADFQGPWEVPKVKKLRDALWANDSLREAFVAENPAGLSPEDLALVRSWKHRRAGAFFVLRHLKKHSILIAEKDSAVYGVLGLASPLEEVTPFVPCYAQAVLLPFEGVIVYDSLIEPYNIAFGKGYRTDLERLYKDAKERGAIVTSLLPQAEPATREERQAAARSTNARVLEAFRTHLYASGLTPRVVERDLVGVTAFAEGHLLGQPEPRSLREVGTADVRGYLSQVRAAQSVKEGQRRQALTGLKRFLRFLRDTGRMDYKVAEDVLGLLKGRR